MQSPLVVLDAQQVKQIPITPNSTLSTFYIPEAGITVSIVNAIYINGSVGLRTTVQYILPSAPTDQQLQPVPPNFLQLYHNHQQQHLQQRNSQQLQQVPPILPTNFAPSLPQTVVNQSTNFQIPTLPVPFDCTPIPTQAVRPRKRVKVTPTKKISVADTDIPSILNLSTADLEPDFQHIFGQLSTLAAN